MIRFALILFFFVINFSGFAQNLNDYSYIVIPNKFEVQSESNQFMLNEMAYYYFDKNGFNVFMEHETPNAPRCDGLYVDVEEKMLLMGTGLYLVLRDCNKEEVYRSEQTRSKHKEYRKAYQDKLRKAFHGLETLKINQRDIAYYSEPTISKDDSSKTTQQKEGPYKIQSKIEVEKSTLNKALPSSVKTIYIMNGMSFQLQKTGEGYSLYSVINSGDDGLQLVGKIIVMDTVIKFMDMGGHVSDAVFEADGTLTIADTVYEKVTD